ncbi:unnamed protein product [Coffea canephora]|uniref:alpha-1,2-Mannosidase n=1 Tax=Coffea canephora TaxID=49390 RepID=A0A068VHQ3_COFCA|nr:unnamed protein product [Coffea canephora]
MNMGIMSMNHILAIKTLKVWSRQWKLWLHLFHWIFAYPFFLSNLIWSFGGKWVVNSLDFNKNYDASVFETTIRLVVGGLLSAYDLSGDKVFLEKAQDIADRLLPTYDTPSGIPYNVISLAHENLHNPGWTGVDSILTDSGTEQLEFIALSQRTGNPKNRQKVSKN